MHKESKVITMNDPKNTFPLPPAIIISQDPAIIIVKAQTCMILSMKYVMMVKLVVTCMISIYQGNAHTCEVTTWINSNF
jgi:hypothetical protein